MWNGQNVNDKNGQQVTQDAEEKKRRSANRRCAPVSSETLITEGMTADEGCTGWAVSWGIIFALFLVSLGVIIFLGREVHKKHMTFGLVPTETFTGTATSTPELPRFEPSLLKAGDVDASRGATSFYF